MTPRAGGKVRRSLFVENDYKHEPIFRSWRPDQGSDQLPRPAQPGGRRGEACSGEAQQGHQLGQFPPHHVGLMIGRSSSGG